LWCGRRAPDGADGTAGEATHQRPTAATGQSADRSARAGAQQSAANRPLARIIRICAGSNG
jgi:hypothetical protein